MQRDENGVSLRASVKRTVAPCLNEAVKNNRISNKHYRREK